MIILGRVSMKIRPPFFITTAPPAPNLPTPPFLWEKSKPPLSVKIPKTQNPPPFPSLHKGRGSNYDNTYIFYVRIHIIFHLSSFGTLVLQAPCYVFYATRCQVYCRFDTNDMAFPSTLIWYYTLKQILTQHTETNRLTHKCISIPLVMCSRCSYLHYFEWITHRYIKNLLYRGP